MKNRRTIYILSVLILTSINCIAEENQLIYRAVNNKKIPYLHSSPINLVCSSGKQYQLSIKRYPQIKVLEIKQQLTSEQLESITLVFENDISIEIDNNRLINDMTCYFGGKWGKDTLWHWLGEKELTSIIINGTNKIQLEDKSIIKSLIKAISAYDI